jgi:hypothetical protein
VNAPNANHKLRGKTQECDHGRLNTFFVLHRLLVRTLLRKMSKLCSQDSIPAKKFLFRPDAREVILRGVSALTDAVRVTLGPKSNVCSSIKTSGHPVVCNYGVTTAKEPIAMFR